MMPTSHNRPQLAVPLQPVDHVIGPVNARPVVVEYGDFECPSCAQAYPAVQILRKRFADHFRFVFRHFPLSEVHPHAMLAAEAAESAGAQGKFWQMHDMLFQHRAHLKPADLRRYAQTLELDMLRYDAEIGDHVYLQRVQEHLLGGRASHVIGTPTFFVDGAVVDTSFGFDRLGEAIAAKMPASR